MDPNHPATILLADDEETLRENLATVLRDEGFEVLASPDGAEAMKVLRHRPVDALITDLRMPGICGMDLIRHARELAPSAAIIVITAYGQVDTAVEALKGGAQDYICKPLVFDEVIYKLKRLLSQEELERENRLLRQQVERGRGSGTETSADATPLGADAYGEAAAGVWSSASPDRPPSASLSDLRSATRAFEKEYILGILARCGFSKPAAAEALGIGLSSLYRKMLDLRIPLRDSGDPGWDPSMEPPPEEHRA